MSTPRAKRAAVHWAGGPTMSRPTLRAKCKKSPIDHDPLLRRISKCQWAPRFAAPESRPRRLVLDHAELQRYPTLPDACDSPDATPSQGKDLDRIVAIQDPPAINSAPPPGAKPRPVRLPPTVARAPPPVEAISPMGSDCDNLRALQESTGASPA